MALKSGQLRIWIQSHGALHVGELAFRSRRRVHPLVRVASREPADGNPQPVRIREADANRPKLSCRAQTRNKNATRLAVSFSALLGD